MTPVWKMSNAELEALVSAAEDSGTWTVLAESAEEELELRENPLPGTEATYDTPSLEDSGRELGSYGS